MILQHPAVRALILTGLLAGLSACASAPRYQTTYRYQPPADPAGLACLDKCTQKMEACQSQCQEKYQACLKRIEPKVDERYGEALKRYAIELDRYRAELDHYRLSLSLSWGHYPWYGHGFYYPWPEPYYFPPPLPPRKPSRDEEFNRLKKEQCDADCGCQPVYDTCFLACGGTRTLEERCIANCPK
jgi:hypothetical protein